MRILTGYLTLAVFLLGGRLVTASESQAAWPRITLAEAKQVQMAGPLAETFERGVARLAGEPYTLDWLLADVSFKVGRIFTNYSGDVSGRFLELAVLSSPPGRLSPPTLAPALAEVANYQRSDGHFGAESEGDCLMFQIQSADSPYRATEFKTRPNTLRPHVRRWEGWTIADPVPLPKEIRRGETHHTATECRGSRIAVFVNGEKVHEQSDAGLLRGSVGFRVSAPSEQGRFQNITLRKL